MSSPSPVKPDRTLAAYAQASLWRGIFSIVTSVIPYLGLSVLAYVTLGVSVFLTIALEILAAGFLVRTFIVFHDCGHGSLLPSRRANRWVGRVAALLVLSPYARWRHDHAVHHATSGDLSRRGSGDVLTLTVAEYQARTPRGRLGYRLLRNPVVMFGIGPIIAMMIGPRIATRSQRPRLRNSVLLTDAVLAVAAAILCSLIGWQSLLVVWAPAAMLAGSAGIWLFYVQHQFEDAYWRAPGDWDYTQAALAGSSHLRLPRILQFFSGNIGLHHVHHLNARVPNYNLPAAHEAIGADQAVPTLTLLDGLRSVGLKLFDEETGRMTTFAGARQSLARPTMPAQPPRLVSEVE